MYDEIILTGPTPFDLTHGEPETAEPATLSKGDLVAAHAHGVVLRAEEVHRCDPEWYPLAEGPVVHASGALELRLIGREPAWAARSVAARRKLVGAQHRGQ